MNKTTSNSGETFSRRVTEVLSTPQLRMLFDRLEAEAEAYALTVSKIGTKGYRIIQLHCDDADYFLKLLNEIKYENQD